MTWTLEQKRQFVFLSQLTQQYQKRPYCLGNSKTNLFKIQYLVTTFSLFSLIEN